MKELATKIYHHSIKVGTVLVASVVFLVLASIIAAGVYLVVYNGRVFAGVRIGTYDVGGMTKKELVDFVENINNRYSREGVEFKIENGQSVKMSNVVGGDTDNAVELIKLNSDAFGSAALAKGRQGNFITQLFAPVYYRMNSQAIDVPLIVNEVALKTELRNSLSGFESKVQNAGLRNITLNGEAEVYPEKYGNVFDYNEIISQLKNSFRTFSFEPIQIRSQPFKPSVTIEEARSVLPNLNRILSCGPLTLQAVTTSLSTSSDWVISPEQLTSFIEVQADNGKPTVSLSEQKTEQFISDEIATKLNRPALDAKFTVEDNKVKEFQASQPGQLVNIAETYKNLKAVFDERNNLESVPTAVAGIVFDRDLPKIETSSLNSLGIVELIGSGTTTFKDSHTRRIQNIAHAVARLNGTLIKPGEVFSSIKYAGPFTLANGYVPEQIIKGKTIVDEVGGGMCQIGTTLFRMAMQTGLPIVERHNHSLVVGYYLDPVNHNPGTDATLFEPTLDLKFLNETPNYLLLLTSIDYKKQMLTFSLWGTKDGRSGGYTHPIVKKWIPAPKETEYIVPAKNSPLNADPTKCQNAFRGAVATFTYTRITPLGEKVDEVFDSYYRPLPKICPTTTPAVVTTTPSQ